jgi:two-component system cell cycle sensor histidine kinase PleC
MSHELRTPLNAIIGFSEILKDEILGSLGIERYRYYAQDIFDSGQHLLSVINDILDISKVEAGQFEICEEETTLQEIAQQSTRLVRERAQKAQLKLTTDIQADLPQIYVDPRLIKQCLINLLSNAIKFSPKRGNRLGPAARPLLHRGARRLYGGRKRPRPGHGSHADPVQGAPDPARRRPGEVRRAPAGKRLIEAWY